MPQSMRQELMSLPGPVRDASDAMKTEIAARVDQKRRNRRRNVGGAIAAGSGLTALGAAINDAYNGSREEQYQ